MASLTVTIRLVVTTFILAIPLNAIASTPCEPPANEFQRLPLTPDRSAVELLRRFAHIRDGDAHQNGWVAARLFSLSNRVTVSGTIRVGSRCKSEQIGDGDLWFYVKLDSQSRQSLARFFDGKLKLVPTEVHVEIIDLCRECSNPPEFHGWESKLLSERIRFSRPGKALGPMNPGGLTSSDWQCLLQNVEWNARITGPLVADLAERTMLKAGLEIHPAEVVELLPTAEANCAP